jgi:2-isopropylmalate synthase
MKVYERQPYSGALVFAAFSGSHQDAIAKGMKWREEKKLNEWTVPYLPIDPRDVGRVYETDVIRINSQSGKGGVSYILENNYSYKLPKKFSEEVSYMVKSVSDKSHNELSPDEILKVFTENYVNKFGNLKLKEIEFDEGRDVKVKMQIEYNDKILDITGVGNGKFESVVNAIISNIPNVSINDLTYDEHGISKGADSNAITYLSFKNNNGKEVWGVGIDHDILTSSIYALFSAINRIM